MRSAQQVNNQSERSPEFSRVPTSSGCSNGASPNLDCRAKRTVPSPPALPSSATASGLQAHQQPLAYGTWSRSSVIDQQLLMAAQQHHQQQLQFPQAHVQRYNEGRHEAASAGANVGGSGLATCKQSSSSSFNGSPSTNASAALEQREEPMLPSTRASDTGMTANRVLRLVQQQQKQQGQHQERCPMPQQHQLPPSAPGHSHLCDEEVASQQQGRVFAPLRLGTGGAATGPALVSEGDTARQLGADTATAAGYDGRSGRLSTGHFGRPNYPDDATAVGNGTEQLTSRAQDAAGFTSGASALTAQRGSQQLQQQQQFATIQSPQRGHPSPADVAAGGGGAMMGTPASHAQQLRQLQLQQQQSQMRQKFHQQQQQQQIFQQQQQQQQAEMQFAQQQQQQQQQQQYNPRGTGQQQHLTSSSIPSSLRGGPDRAGGPGSGMEAQVRARLGLPPKRANNQQQQQQGGNGHGVGAGGFGVAGSNPSGVSPAGPVHTSMSDNRLGPEGAVGAAGHHVRMRLMAAAQAAAAAAASSQTSSPSMSCSASQATVTAPPHLHTSGSATNEAISGLGQLGGGTGSELLPGSSPAMFPSQRRQQHEMLVNQQQQQQQRMSVRQALLRGSAAAAVTQAGGPFAAAAAAAAAFSGVPNAQLERASSAPQAALETQIAAARLRKLEQMGISPSQAVLAVAAGGRFSGMQPQLACRTTAGYMSAAAASNPSSETGSPVSGRSFKRSVADRCWEEQQQLQMHQQQQQQQQQQLQMHGMAGLASGGPASAGTVRHAGPAGLGMGASIGAGGMGGLSSGDALQAMKRTRAYAQEMVSVNAGRGFSSQSMHRFDPAAATQQQQQHEATMMCRSMPEDIRSIAMMSPPGGGGDFSAGCCGGGFPIGGGSSQSGMSVHPGIVQAAPMQPHMGGGGPIRTCGPGPGAGMARLGGGLGPLDGSGGLGPGAGMLNTGSYSFGAMGAGTGMGMGGMPPGNIGLASGDLNAPMVMGGGSGGGRPSAGCGDGLGPASMVPRCSDAAMDLADLGPDPDYLADPELQSFIEELCAPVPGEQDQGLAGAGPGGAEGACAQDVAMSEGAAGGSAMEGQVPGAARSVGGAGAGAGCSGAFHRPHLPLDEEQRALQTEAEALLNFRFD